jgi:hypothetical protein
MGFLSLGKKVMDPFGLVFKPKAEQVQQQDLLNPFENTSFAGADRASNANLGQQQAFLNALQAQGGVQNQSSVFQQQQGLANQLGLMAQGGGPNPAAAQLAQATGDNVANQAALIASQRGASANAGMAARLAAQQGGNIMQQAAGQGATLQAQQQLAAINALQNQQQGMGNIATQQVNQQQNATMGLTAAQQAQQQMYLNAIQGQNNNITGQNAQAMQAATARTAADNQMKGAVLQTGGALAGTFYGGPAGGAAGGKTGQQMAQNTAAPMPVGVPTMTAAHGGVVPGKATIPGDHPQNDTVSAALSPGEIVIPRSVLDSPDPANAAMHFVAGIMASKKNTPDNHLFAGGMTQEPLNEPSESPIWDAINGGGVLRSPEAKNQLGKIFQGGLMAPPSNYVPPQVETAAVPAPASLNPAQPLMPESSAMPEAAAPVVPDPAATPSMVRSGMNTAIQGLERQAQAEGDLGNKQAALLDQQAQQQQELAQSYAENRAKLDQEIELAQQDYASGKIDPSRYVQSMSGGQKVATAIGLILGGIGQGYSGGENVALKLLQKNIDQDIDAQKADMGKKENLLSINFRKYGNLKDATEMTRVMSQQAVANQLEKAAAESKDPLAKARAMQAVGDIKMKAGVELDKLARQQTVRSMVQGGKLPPERAIAVLVPENEQKEAREELKKVTAAKKAIKNSQAIFKELEQLSAVGASMPYSEQNEKYNSARTRLRTSIGAGLISITGALKEGDLDNFINPLMPEKLTTKAGSKVKLKGVREFFKSQLDGGTPTLSGNGINVSLDPDLSPQEKQWAEYAQKNPDAPGSRAMLEKLGLD